MALSAGSRVHHRWRLVSLHPWWGKTAFDQRTTELSAWSSRKCWHDKAANHRKKNTNHCVNKKYNNGYALKKKEKDMRIMMSAGPASSRSKYSILWGKSVVSYNSDCTERKEGWKRKRWCIHEVCESREESEHVDLLNTDAASLLTN